MSITLDKVLARLESELERAMDTGNVQKKREHLAAMKSLCELALETEVEAVSSYTRTAGSPTTALAVQPSPPFQQQAPTYTPPTQAPPITNIPSKPIKEDDANGDSLFDF